MITDHEQITKKKRKKTFYIIKLLPNCSKKKTGSKAGIHKIHDNAGIVKMSLEDSYLITYFLRVLASINHHLEQDFIVCALEAVHCWSRFLKKYLLSVSF